MYHLLRTIPLPIYRPSHLLGRFVGHKKPLDPWYEWKILKDLFGYYELRLLTITVVDLHIPRGLALETVFFIDVFFSK